MSLRILKKLIALCTISIVLFPALSQAAFNQNYILSDNDLTDKDAMSLSRVQQFLESQNSALATYTTNALGGTTKRASDIIFDAAQYWKISPKYLITRMQVEQSLITSTSPTTRQLDWATGYAVCDSCSTDDPSIQPYKGFFNQVNWAARRIRQTYLPGLESNGMTLSGWGPGITKTTSEGDVVTPLNDATAAMYTYTPHVHGNYLVWTVWNRWFIPQYPDGSILQDESGAIWKIENGNRRLFKSKSSFLSRYSLSQVIQVSRNVIDAYDVGSPIQFPNYALVRVPGSHTYLLDGDTKRRILSPDVFRELGFNPEEIIVVTAADLAGYADAEPISLQSSFPAGILFRSNATGAISFIQNGVRHAIVSKEILKSRFSTRVLTVVDDATIQKYAPGDPIIFNEGELVATKGNPKIYFISNGTKRPISTSNTFTILGFKWKNVIWTNQKSLDIIPLGDPITAG